VEELRASAREGSTSNFKKPKEVSTLYNSSLFLLNWSRWNILIRKERLKERIWVRKRAGSWSQKRRRIISLRGLIEQRRSP
jgi:hypothetical protein